ncbi:MAG: ISAs1 family transposase [Planctomycetaceae bacterium]|nr:ISAs1 family transposase [Planctomycetaceae bacterium]
MKTLPAGLLQFLQRVPDPRGRKGRRHPLTAMLAVVVAAMLCKFEGYESVAQWVRLLPIEFWHAFGGTRKPPCANCYRELMNEVCSLELERALNAWITEGLGLNLEDEAAGIIIDGKVLRGTRSDHNRTMQILTALDQHTGCVLSETAIAADTNEAKTAVEFLKSLVLEGKTVVGDAGFCQRDICETILSDHGEYLILVKDNQPTLHKEAIQAFVIPEGSSPLCQAQSV